MLKRKPADEDHQKLLDYISEQELKQFISGFESARKI